MRMRGAIRRLFNPMLFQGSVRAKRYFEGWYFKQVSRDRRWAFAFIPGISLSAGGSHSFVQLIDGSTGSTRYFPFPVADFHADAGKFLVRIGANRFSLEGLEAHLEDAEGAIDVRLSYSAITPLASGPLSPGIMGPYAFAPFMECYHGIGSLRHHVSGEVRIGGVRFDMDGGTGYLEKDWGRSMPSAWVWAHSNTFGSRDACLVFSLARVPWLGGSFPGFFCVLLVDGVQRRFATYTGASVSRFVLSGRDLGVDIRDRSRLLAIRAHRSHEGILRAPVEGAMDRRIGESMDARLAVRLQDTDGALLFEGTGDCGGLEVVGDVSTLAPCG
jgi:tocopherol cyclase